MDRTEPLLVEVDDGVLSIRINRPRALNALTRETGAELLRILRHAGRAEAVRAVTITGTNGAFCVGADLKAKVPTLDDGRPDLGGALREVFNPIIFEMRRLSVPVIAVVNGPAVGFGLSLALAADLVLMADSAMFALGFGAVGLAPDGGATAFLAARLGHARAHQLAFTGQPVDAATALDWGLVNSVHPTDDLPAATGALVREVKSGAPKSHASSKALFNRVLYSDLKAQLDREARLQEEHAATEDFAEGVAAFREQRPPFFTGR